MSYLVDPPTPALALARVVSRCKRRWLRRAHMLKIHPRARRHARPVDVPHADLETVSRSTSLDTSLAAVDAITTSSRKVADPSRGAFFHGLRAPQSFASEPLRGIDAFG